MSSKKHKENVMKKLSVYFYYDICNIIFELQELVYTFSISPISYKPSGTCNMSIWAYVNITRCKHHQMGFVEK